MVTRGSTQFNLNALLNHINACWNPQVGLWATSNQTNLNGCCGCPTPVREIDMFWLSEEDEVVPAGVYEHGYAAQAKQAIQTMQGFNPWQGTYRNQILYGSLIPVGAGGQPQTGGGGAPCQTIAMGTTNGFAYRVYNNPVPSIANVNAAVYSANGDLAYCAINDFIRGGVNYKTWINTIEASWDGVGFNTTGGYTARSFGAAGCAILVCDYDPRNIFPAMDAAAAALQDPATGSFPNGGSVRGAGDLESCNKFLLWRCPQWLAWMQSLKNTATYSTPHNSIYVPPAYIISPPPPPPMKTSMSLTVVPA